MNDQRTMIDSKAVARLIGSTERHVWSLCANRLIPHYKVGGKLRFNRGEVLDWLEKQKREAVS
jgi:excisionase family DNA binding protein